MRVRLFAGGPGRGHLSRCEAVAEVLEERGHEVIWQPDSGLADYDDWWIVDDYDFDWDQCCGVRTAHVDDFNRPHPDADIHWVPIGERALVRRAFRKGSASGSCVGFTDATKAHGFSAETMASVFAHSDTVRTTASVKAWEALTCGAKLDLLPPNDNQRLAYEALKAGVTTDGRGAERLVDEMEKRSA